MAEKKPPKHRDKTIGSRVDEETYARGKAKAEAEGRTIADILRSFFLLWANDETPPGFPPELEDQEGTAERRHTKKQGRPPKK